MKKTNKGLFTKLFVSIVIACLIPVGCQLGNSFNQSPEGTIQTSPTNPAIITEGSKIPPDKVRVDSGEAEVLSACDLEDQFKAMKPDQIPDWESLDLSTCYDLDLHITENGNSYTGSETLTYLNVTGQPLTSLLLRLYPNAKPIYGGKLQVTSVQVEGGDIPFEVTLGDATGFQVNLPEPLDLGQSITLDLDFSGDVPTDFGGQSNVYGIFNYASGDQVLTLANWYPILAEWGGNNWVAETVTGIGDAVVSETALYKVQITLPVGWQVVTTGSEVGKTIQNASQRLVFTSGPTRDFIVSASPHFNLNQIMVDGIEINHWGLPSIIESENKALQITSEAVNLYDKVFGTYPYAELDVVSVPLNLASGVEYPGVFLVGEEVYDPNSDPPFLLDIVTAHETSHQWWYGVVGNNVLLNPWQDEALATFSSLVFLQNYQNQYYNGTLDYYRSQVAQVEDSGDNTEVSQSVSAFVNRPREYGPVVYDKGALFLEALRERLGDDLFFAALQNYYQENRYRLVGPSVLLGSFEESCGCSLNDVYSRWGVK